MGLPCHGRCAVFLVAALVLDLAGLALVLAGAVGQPKVDGASLVEFLVLSGALLLFLSLLLWLFWYSGNLPGVPAAELPLGARPAAAAAPVEQQRPPRSRRSQASLLRLAAKLSERLSQRRRPAAPAPSPSLLPPDGAATDSPRGEHDPAVSAAAAAAAASSASPGRPARPLELSSLGRAPPTHPQLRRAAEERLV